MSCALIGALAAPVAAQQSDGSDGSTGAPLHPVISATFEDPTRRYNHAVLGPNAEWGSLRITTDTCPACAATKPQDHLIRLPQERVFEDLTPRLIDLDHDGAPEVVVIESHANKGARLAIYGSLGLITATPYIGTGFRWLAPLGAADLDGDGAIELAYIDRPHLAKTLRVWRYQDQSLTQIASLGGLTNHRIGEDFISGGIRHCGAVPEIITADARWRKIMSTTLNGGTLNSREIGNFTGPASLENSLSCP